MIFRTLFRVSFAVLLLMSAACTKPQQEDVATAAFAAPIDVSECQACGMVVRDQPAPRGQAIHRDGTRVFFCSIGDMVRYLQTPSPHGRAHHLFVEVMPEKDNPLVLDSGELSWVRAEEVAFVTGVPRRGIMGEPILAYKDQEAATQIALAHQGAVWDYPALCRELIGSDAR